MNEFFHKIAETVEVDEVKNSDVLADLPNWDSLTVLTLIAIIGSTYSVTLNAAAVREAHTAGGLWQAIQARRPA